MSLADDKFYRRVIRKVMERQSELIRHGSSTMKLPDLYFIKEKWKEELALLRNQKPPHETVEPVVDDNLEEIGSGEEEESGTEAPSHRWNNTHSVLVPPTMPTIPIITESTQAIEDDELHPSLEQEILEELDEEQDDDDGVADADEITDEQYEELKTKPFNEDDDRGETTFSDMWTEVDAMHFDNAVAALYSLFKRFIRRNKTAWYFIFKYGVITVGNKELLFSRAEGRIEFT